MARLARDTAGSSGSTALPVVVLGKGLTALGVQRSFASVGVDTLLVDDTRSVAARSRWARGRIIAHPETSDPADLQSMLDSLPVDRAVLMACSDNWATALAALPDTSDGRFIRSMPSQPTVELLADKATLAEKLQHLGVAHPWTHVITSPDDLDDVPEDKWSNIFLKPTDSQSFSELFGVKAFSVTDRADARQRLEQMHAAGIGAVAQEYIPGRSDRHYFIDGFVDRHGTIRALLSRNRMRMFPPDYGNSTFFETVPLEMVSNAISGLEVLLPALSYRGIFSAEFKHDPRDDVFRLLEVNVRPWWYVEFATLCGVNVCELAYLDAQEQPVPERMSFAAGKRHMLMPDEIYAFRHYRRHSDLTFGSWLGQIWGASDAMFRRNDPLPAFDAVFNFPRRVVNKLRKVFRQMRKRT